MVLMVGRVDGCTVGSHHIAKGGMIGDRLVYNGSSGGTLVWPESFLEYA